MPFPDEFQAVVHADAREVADRSLRYKFGNSARTVKSQIWCAVSTYALIGISKKELELPASSVFDKTLMSQALRLGSIVGTMQASEKQLCLFDS
jgi:hypothetical protein